MDAYYNGAHGLDVDTSEVRDIARKNKPNDIKISTKESYTEVEPGTRIVHEHIHRHEHVIKLDISDLDQQVAGLIERFADGLEDDLNNFVNPSNRLTGEHHLVQKQGRRWGNQRNKYETRLT